VKYYLPQYNFFPKTTFVREDKRNADVESTGNEDDRI
jgi:hypothetical protein